MRISDWSSDVCSSDLRTGRHSLPPRTVPEWLSAGERVMVAREVLSGTFNGLERLDLCVLNVLSQSPEGAFFSLSDEYRPRLRKFLRMKPPLAARSRAIGRAHVCTPVTNAHLVCRLLLE